MDSKTESSWSNPLTNCDGKSKNFGALDPEGDPTSDCKAFLNKYGAVKDFFIFRVRIYHGLLLQNLELNYLKKVLVTNLSVMTGLKITSTKQ